jgi:hypothetical protein
MKIREYSQPWPPSAIAGSGANLSQADEQDVVVGVQKYLGAQDQTKRKQRSRDSRYASRYNPVEINQEHGREEQNGDHNKTEIARSPLFIGYLVDLMRPIHGNHSIYLAQPIC